MDQYRVLLIDMSCEAWAQDLEAKLNVLHAHGYVLVFNLIFEAPVGLRYVCILSHELDPDSEPNTTHPQFEITQGGQR